MELAAIDELDSMHLTVLLNVNEGKSSVSSKLARESGLASVFNSLRIR